LNVFFILTAVKIRVQSL